MKRTLPFHPLLFAVAPILFLYSHNVAKLPISPAELLLPLAVSLGATVILWLVLCPLFRSVRRAALVVSLFLVLFFLYGHVFNAVGAKTGHAPLLAASAVIIACGVVLAVRRRSGFSGLTVLLNLVSTALVAINLVAGVPPLLRPRMPASESPEASLPGTKGFPDIYYIILDSYARQDVLERIYHYDNSDFTDYLRSKGFLVASRSRPNYAQTYLSLASSLNMTYLDSVAQEVGPESDDHSPLLGMIAHNRVVGFLRQHGYTIVSFASGYTGTELADADVHFAPRWALGEFENVLISTTALPLFLKLAFRQSEDDLERQRVLYAFERLPDAARLRPPVFVFCHVVAPHPPFIFGPNGEKVNSKDFYTFIEGSPSGNVDEQKVREDFIEGYCNQLAFVTLKTRETVDRILARSSRPPVIILQGDHGPGSFRNWDELDPGQLAERMAILNAYTLPQASSGPAWYDSISPVNTFRMVLDRVFGETLPLLPDKSWFSTFKRPFRFFDADHPETYEAARYKRAAPLTILAFRPAGTPALANPGRYARKLAGLRYPGEARRVAGIRFRQVRAGPEGLSVQSAYQAYRDAVKSGDVPDLGTECDSFAGRGPDRVPVTALFFYPPTPPDSVR